MSFAGHMRSRPRTESDGIASRLCRLAENEMLDGAHRHGVFAETSFASADPVATTFQCLVGRYENVIRELA